MKQFLAFCLLTLFMSVPSLATPIPPAPSEKIIFQHHSNFAVVYLAKNDSTITTFRAILSAKIDKDFTLNQDSLTVFADQKLEIKYAAFNIQTDRQAFVLFDTTERPQNKETWKFNKTRNTLSRLFKTSNHKFYMITYFNKIPPRNQEKFLI